MKKGMLPGSISPYLEMIKGDARARGAVKYDFVHMLDQAFSK